MANRRSGRRHPALVPQSTGARNGNTAPSKREARVAKKKRQKVSIPTSLRRLPPQTAGAKSDKITYVIDTNVLLTDWSAIYKFDEHDVVIVGQVWRELDKQKKGQSDQAFHARRTISAIEKLVGASSLLPEEMQERGIPIVPPEDLKNGRPHSGQLFLRFAQPEVPEGHAFDLDPNEPDDKILLACLKLQQEGRRVVLVSRDGNLRVRSLCINVAAEEYLSDAVIESSSNEEDMSPGFHRMPKDFWDKLKQSPEIEAVETESRYTMKSTFFRKVEVNEFLLFEDGAKLIVREKPKPDEVVAYTFNHHSLTVSGIHSLNDEQDCALQLLLDENIPAVSLAGPAGTGKTFLAIAAGLDQIKKKVFRRMIITRPTVPSGEEIGYFTGDETDKMSAWMGSVFDNLDIIQGVRSKKANSGKGSIGDKDYLQQLKIRIHNIGVMKGRTINDTFIIVDETQDLTRKQIKMLATRLGRNSKIVFLGNAAQIDSSFLTEYTSGLSVFIRTFHSAELVGHVTLQKGERTEFATLAEELL